LSRKKNRGNPFLGKDYFGTVFAIVYPYLWGVFLFTSLVGVIPLKTGGGANIVSNPYIISQFIIRFTNKKKPAFPLVLCFNEYKTRS
jgi:hypothetical protein